ncbi:uncharacterized protein LOC144079427 isoform X1 [Stigmatopora argus]
MPAGHLMISRRRRCSLTAGSRGCWSLYQLTFGTSVQPAYPASFGDVGTGVPKKTHTSPVTTCKLHGEDPVGIKPSTWKLRGRRANHLSTGPPPQLTFLGLNPPARVCVPVWLSYAGASERARKSHQVEGWKMGGAQKKREPVVPPPGVSIQGKKKK